MTQNEMILKHLRDGKPIDPMQCLKLFNCWSLRSRISEIEGKSGHRKMLKAGESISREWVRKNGKQYRRYRLVVRRANAA